MTTASPAPAAVDPGDRSWGWHLYRVSGLALAVLLPVVLVSGLLTTDVADWSAQAVADRWDDSRWRVIDWAFLVLGLTHGGMGVAALVRSGRRDPRWARLAVAVVSVVLVVIGMAATEVVFTFEL